MLNHVQFLRPHGLLPTRFLCPWHFPGKNTGVSYHFLLQGIILIQGSNLGFLCYRKSPALQAGSLPTEPPGKPLKGTFSSVQFSSVAQWCPTLCDAMNCSTPGLPVLHQLQEFTQTHVHRVSDAIKPSHPLSSPSPVPNPSQHQGFFQ